MNDKTKNTLILLAILIILIIVLFVWQNPWQKQESKIPTAAVLNNNLTDLQKIEIKQTDKTTILTEQDNQWLVASADNAVANQNLVNNLIEALNNITKGTIVSANSDKLADFNLTENTAINLKLFNSQDQLITELLIGKSGPAYTQSYLKKIDSDNILLVDENLTSLLNQPDWKQPPATEANNTGTPENIPLELQPNN
jgi:hypothetical protein